MDSQFVAALIGALVGGGLSVWGGKLAARYTAERERTARAAGYGKDAYGEFWKHLLRFENSLWDDAASQNPEIEGNLEVLNPLADELYAMHLFGDAKAVSATHEAVRALFHLAEGISSGQCRLVGDSSTQQEFMKRWNFYLESKRRSYGVIRELLGINQLDAADLRLSLSTRNMEQRKQA